MSLAGGLHRRAFFLAPLILCVLFVMPTALRGETRQNEDGGVCHGSVCFPAKAALDTAELPIRNAAKLRYLGFSLYTSALYLPEHVEDLPGSLGKEPMRFVLHYHRGFSRAQINKAAEKAISSDPSVDMAAIRAALDAAYAIHQDVKEGDEYELTFVPDVGTTFVLNGKKTGHVAGNEFARAYFGIWLGARPISDRFRDSLSARLKPREQAHGAGDLRHQPLARKEE